jgi:putative protease
MKKSRSSSKKRGGKKKPAKRKPAKRKVVKKTKKTAKSRSAAARRRTGAKARTRSAAKKTRARKATKKTATRAGGRKRPVSKTKKASTKKPARAAAPRIAPVLVPAAPVVPANELKAGVVTHYYSHLSVAVVAVTDRRLQLGNRIHVKGHTSDFYQTVGSMQIEHDTISVADVGQTVGLKVAEHAREHDTVYLVT